MKEQQMSSNGLCGNVLAVALEQMEALEKRLQEETATDLQIPVEKEKARVLMEPMCDKMQSWKAGEFTHADMDQALEECHQQVCELRNILNQRKDRLVMLIQWLDREWFEAWVKEHRPPPDARLASPPE